MLKSEISNLQVEKSLLESRVSGLLSTRAGEKATLSSLEKKLADERKQKAEFQVKPFLNRFVLFNRLIMFLNHLILLSRLTDSF